MAKQIELGLEKHIAEKIFGDLKLEEYQQLLDGKRPKILATIANELLLAALVKRKWISSFEESKDNSDYFQAYGSIIRKNK